jgi:hypothetical protein
MCKGSDGEGPVYPLGPSWRVGGNQSLVAVESKIKRETAFLCSILKTDCSLDGSLWRH